MPTPDDLGKRSTSDLWALKVSVICAFDTRGYVWTNCEGLEILEQIEMGS